MDAMDTTRSVLSKVSGLEASLLEENMSLVADLGVDSAKALQLLADLEDALDIEIADEDAARMNTVADVFGYVRGLS